MDSFQISTASRSQFIDITSQVQKVVAESRISDGLCHIWVPHTTAGLTVNENADPSVVEDILKQLDRMVPWGNHYRHGEGNSAAHIKSSLMGCHLTVVIKDGRLQLGTWQGIYFCEFDGPRQRQIWLKTVQC
ncbi:MAG: secondary thiamine-phosphate synthase enzyme YjbQ [Candidatus Edwardsbacteria bacterium]|nr:secondary thiamine-phosphate synthase enzyme YjbQ [Candidatus Edwardsbacteria bacterium]MBU1576062.1 secondary thiamine-phosphate synthase enzyme YjbQ [Candidatus Edwardsbacteria bacterium]MBU2463664.1 secondary thiamine-phosphate synthase enzyme YjbQ [Candidatus Edwardsbacteria bacterium]MBU2594132.1 secondary thiamine-phosphate synthase enzyme YjbQ [Candidatus Edwardsbacteria bacterium]